MSIEAFPVLYFNMAGEMIYIVEQRLTAQSIDTSKADKVINEILIAIFTPGLITEVFKRQKLLSVYFLRQMFEKLAHSSIMKLNEQSMNKLFDLMVMVTKYQVVFCNTPIDLIHITLNHLTSLCQMTRHETTLKMIENSMELFAKHYLKSNWSKLQHIRYTILAFLQDIKTRVSIFLRDGSQENDGKFVMKPEGVVSCDCQIPGTIKYFDQKDEIKRVDKFESLGVFVVSNEKTILGHNIYSKEYSKNEFQDKLTSVSESNDNQMLDNVIICNKSAKNELNLLAKLIGREKSNEPQMDIWLNLGNDESIPETSDDKRIQSNELNISEGIHNNKSLENIINDLIDVNIEDNNSSNDTDLLELMDS